MIAYPVPIKALDARTPEERAKVKADDEKTQIKLRAILRRPENRECADCTSNHCNFTVVNFGVFVCLDCAQIHRHIGKTISQTKGLATYNFYPDEVHALDTIGNALALAVLGGGVPKPKQTDSRAIKEEYVRDKYERKKYFRPDLFIPNAPGGGAKRGAAASAGVPQQPPAQQQPQQPVTAAAAPVATAAAAPAAKPTRNLMDELMDVGPSTSIDLVSIFNAPAQQPMQPTMMMRPQQPQQQPPASNAAFDFW